MSLTFPADRSPDILTYPSGPRPDRELCITEALAHPIASLPLSELAKSRRDAVILISDISRLCPSYLFLPALIDQLNAGGIDDSRIRIVVALGLHRKQTEEELRQLTGETVYKRVRVVNHSALSEDCIPVGTTSQGTPVEINRTVAGADLLIATGNVEPHALAGLSGGVKALMPGTASHRSIECNHALSLTYKTVPGQTANPIHRDMEEAQQFVPIHFLFNVVVDHERRILAAACGQPAAAHRVLSELAGKAFISTAAKKYDITIVSAGGYPKDTQLYQALKALKNAAAVTKPGGEIVLAAECGEMLGNGIFQYWVDTMPNRAYMVARLQKQFVVGAHKILHIDEVLRQHKVHLYSSMGEAAVRLLGFEPVAELQAAYDRLTADRSKSIALMPYGSLTFTQG
nr:nickel-dependent lactate racemase [Paenibacillus thalictri]